jgi:hypothetical protein
VDKLNLTAGSSLFPLPFYSFISRVFRPESAPHPFTSLELSIAILFSSFDRAKRAELDDTVALVV